MMVVNGASSLQEVWCQNVTVNPNSNYIFQAFATSVNPASPAILQFAINGVLMDSPFSLSGTVCEWEEFYTIWSSGSNTSIEICITNQNTAAGGNDFAIDDIFFSEFCEDEEEITIFYQEFEAEISPATTLTCSQPSSTLTAYTIPYITSCDYQWDTQNGSITSPSNTQTIVVSTGGTYEVTVTDPAGCTRTASVEIEEDTESPDISLIGDPQISCTSPSTTLYGASSSGNGLFTWTLPDGTSRQGESIDADQPGTYIVSTSGQNGCTGIASVNVEFETPEYLYRQQNDGPLTCANKETWVWVDVQSLHDSIQWQGPGIQAYSVHKDSVRVNVPGYYVFTIFLGQNCQQKDSIRVNEIPANIDYILSPPTTITCREPNAFVLLTPLSPVSVTQWYQNGSLFATGDTLITSAPGMYQVEIFDIEGCKKTDTVVISGDLAAPAFSVITDSIGCATMTGGFSVTGPPTNNYHWEAPDGTIIVSSMPRFTEQGEYILTVTGENGCEEKKIYPLPSTVNYPKIDVTSDTITCSRTVGTILIQQSGNALISWIGPNNQTGISTTIQSSIPGIYEIIAVSSNGCISRKEAFMSIDTLKPFLELSPSYTLNCISSTAIADVQASDFHTLQWQNPDGSVNSASLSPSLSIPGQYTLTLQNKNGCAVTKSCLVIHDTDPPVFSAGAADLTCLMPESKLVLSGSAGLQYLDPTGNEITDTYWIRQQGIYPIKAVGPNGCDSTIQVKVNAFLEAPSVYLDTLVINCQNPSGIVRDILFDPSNNYFWTTGSGIFNSDSFLVTKGINIIMTAVNPYGCRKSVPVPVREDFSAPKAMIDGPEVIPCQESSITLRASDVKEGLVYTWKNDAGIQSQLANVEVTEEGDYSLIVFNPQNGCTSATAINITKMTGPVFELPTITQPRCYGDQGVLTLAPAVGGQAPFVWTLDKKNVNQGSTLNVTPGTHSLQVTDANRCTFEATIVIESPTDFSVYAGRDTIIAYSDRLTITGSTTLSESAIRSIEWQPAEIFSCPTCLNPDISPDSDVKCSLEVTDDKGCVHQDEVFVRVRFDKGVIAPNIFTPGKNGGNQRFTLYPVKSTIEKIDQLRIYDRWGNLLFVAENMEAGNPELGWDGTLNGRRLSQGVYTWVAMVSYKNQTSEWVKGDITILD
jgi:gliding motility-associated-like protein